MSPIHFVGIVRGIGKGLWFATYVRLVVYTFGCRSLAAASVREYLLITVGTIII